MMDEKIHTFPEIKVYSYVSVGEASLSFEPTSRRHVRSLKQESPNKIYVIYYWGIFKLLFGPQTCTHSALQ